MYVLMLKRIEPIKDESQNLISDTRVDKINRLIDAYNGISMSPGTLSVEALSLVQKKGLLLLQKIIYESKQLLAEYLRAGKVTRAYYSKSKTLKINQLTETESEAKTKDVKPILPGLLARLRKATEEPGKKSELAKFLDAPLASVSRWLSADPKVQREPGGEIALKMLHWVEAQERKQ